MRIEYLIRSVDSVLLLTVLVLEQSIENYSNEEKASG